MSKLSDVLAAIEKDTKLVIQQLGDAKWPTIERIPSGALALDYALGGGWPRGRFAEIFGAPSGGKTFLTLLGIAETQRLGGRAAFFDVEHAFDPQWAKALGVDVDKLFFTQPDHGEQALEAVRKLAESNEFDMIVLDSIAELVPKAVLENQIGESAGLGSQARMMSTALQVLSPAIGKTKAVVLFINQTRASMNMYGDPETTPGGQAFKFYASIRVKVSRVSQSEKHDSNKALVGHDLNVNVKKNKTCPPFRTATISIKYLSGVDHLEDFVNTAVARNIFKFSGGVKYFGTSVESLKDMKWKTWEDFNNWWQDATMDQTLRDAILREVKGIA